MLDWVALVIVVVALVLIILWWTYRESPSSVADTGSSDTSTGSTKEGSSICGGAKGVYGKLFNSYLEKSTFPVPPITDTPTPPSFDQWRQRNLLLPPRDQKGCGSCWAFSAVGVMGHRYVILTNGAMRVPLSAQYLVSCDDQAAGCEGANSLHNVFASLTYTGTGLGVPGGTVAETVYPYEEPVNNAQTQPCDKSKVQGAVIYDFIDSSVVCLSESDDTGSMTPAQLQDNIMRIKQEVMKGGPVSACYAVYDDFMSWDGQGIYRVSSSPSNNLQGYHAVVIVGWGTDTASNSQYWICQNSWGTGWGQGGYWYHLMGDGKTFIESNCHSATPKPLSQLTRV